MEKTKRENFIEAAAEYFLDAKYRIVRDTWDTEAKQVGRDYLGNDMVAAGACLSELCFKMVVSEHLDENMRQTIDFITLFNDINKRIRKKAIDRKCSLEQDEN